MKNTLKSIVAIFAIAIAYPAGAQAPPPAFETDSSKVNTAAYKDERPPLRRGEFGIRYMPNFSYLNLRRYNGEVVGGELAMTHGFGAMLAFNFTRHVGIQAEANFSSISQEYTDRSRTRTVNLTYLNIPLLLSLNIDKSAPININIVAGPQYGMNMSAGIDGDSGGGVDTVQAVVHVRPGDFGLAYGAGLEVMLNKVHSLRLDLGFRGYYGVVNINADETAPDTYNVLVSGSRKMYSGYVGVAFLF